MPHETHLIGPPGTGKTTWLQKQVRRALERYSPAEILVMSFTKAAAANIAGRGTPLPRKNIATIHSFAFRLLGKPVIAESKVSLYNEGQPPEWQLTSGGVDEDGDLDGGVDFGGGKATNADALFSQAQSLRSNLIPRDKWPSKVLAWFEDEWEVWKEQNGLADFTDLLEHTLEDDSELEWEVTPKVCFVDEAQDNSPLEMALVRKWSQRMQNLILCGDPDQAIYAFKGANPQAMVTTNNPSNRVVLHQSYRVPRRIHAIARKLILSLGNEREDAPYDPAPREGEVQWLTSCTWSDPEHAVEQAIESARDGRTAMLLTSCSYQIEPTRRLLRKKAQPFWNPYRLKRGDWNPLALGGRGITAAERLLRFTKLDTATHGKDAKMWTWNDLRAWVTPLAASAFIKGKRAECLRACEHNIEQEEAEADNPIAVFEPLTADDLEAWFEPDDLQAATTGDLEWYYANLMTSQRKRFTYAYEVAREHGVLALKQEPRIVIGTIHSVKGGEAEDVWLFPDLSVAAHRESVINGPGQNVRTFYVGVTRASRKLTMTPACEPYHMHELEFMVQQEVQDQRAKV